MEIESPLPATNKTVMGDRVSPTQVIRAAFKPEEHRLFAMASTEKPQLGGLHSQPMTAGLLESPITAIARSWLGTPYIHQASVKQAGCDCLGLLRGVWRELYGDEPQDIPPYSPDWAEASGEETLRNALAIHLHAIDRQSIAPGDIAVFRMLPHMPAKHCGIVGDSASGPTLIHARQNKRVSEEPFSPAWRRKLAYAFRL